MPYKDKKKHKEACSRNYYKNKEQYRAVQRRYLDKKRRIKGIGFIDIGIFNERFLAQNGKCEICFKDLSLKGKDTHFDHNHITKKLRGILCSGCNVGLGQFQESSVALGAAIKYLEKYK